MTGCAGRRIESHGCDIKEARSSLHKDIKQHKKDACQDKQPDHVSYAGALRREKEQHLGVGHGIVREDKKPLSARDFATGSSKRKKKAASRYMGMDKAKFAGRNKVGPNRRPGRNRKWFPRDRQILKSFCAAWPTPEHTRGWSIGCDARGPITRQEQTLEGLQGAIDRKPSTAVGRATYLGLSPIAHAA